MLILGVLKKQEFITHFNLLSSEPHHVLLLYFLVFFAEPQKML